MKPIAVYVATTGGAVRIERITPERAPQSMVCLGRTSSILPVSGDYDDFVRRGSGVIERDFGDQDYDSFRLDISGPVGTGKSWQLGVYVAHGIIAAEDCELAESDDDAEEIIWLTGRVDYDLQVHEVDHLFEKVKAARPLFDDWTSTGATVKVIVPAGANFADVEAAELPSNVQYISAERADLVCAMLNIGADPVTDKSSSKSNKSMDGRLAVILMVGGFIVGGFVLVAPAKTGAVGEWKQSILKLVGLESQQPNERAPPPSPPPSQPGVKQPPLVKSPPVALPAPIVVAAPANKSPPLVQTANLPKPGQPLKLYLAESRAPGGGHCAQIIFGGKKPEFSKVVRSNSAANIFKFAASSLGNVCGLRFSFDLGVTTKYVAAHLDIKSGSYVKGSVRPRVLGGSTEINGRHNWSIDIPRRLGEPFVYRLVALVGASPVAEEMTWLKKQLAQSVDWPKIVEHLNKRRVQVIVGEHRVDP